MPDQLERADGLVAEPTRLTYRDISALPEDGKRYEILDGDLFMSPAPEPFHQRIVRDLAYAMITHVRQLALGEVFFAPCDVMLGENDIVEPDIIFIAQVRLGIIERKIIRGVPDLLVEVLSPSRPELDTRHKRNVYERCGVPFYWIVDPDGRQVTELQLLKGGYAVAATVGGKSLFKPRLFPGLEIDLQTLWE